MKRARNASAACTSCKFSPPNKLSTPSRTVTRTVRALAMVAEVVHEASRFSFAHGGKDRHTFPVPLRVYDQTNRVLKSAAQNAKLGREEELAALKRLDDQARLIERSTSGPPA